MWRLINATESALGRKFAPETSKKETTAELTAAAEEPKHSTGTFASRQQSTSPASAKFTATTSGPGGSVDSRSNAASDDIVSGRGEGEHDVTGTEGPVRAMWSLKIKEHPLEYRTSALKPRTEATAGSDTKNTAERENIAIDMAGPTGEPDLSSNRSDLVDYTLEQPGAAPAEAVVEGVANTPGQLDVNKLALEMPAKRPVKKTIGASPTKKRVTSAPIKQGRKQDAETNYKRNPIRNVTQKEDYFDFEKNYNVSDEEE